MTATTSTTGTIGARPQGVKATKIEAGGAWNETPYFGPGLKENKGHMLAFPAGMELCGTLKALRTTKAEKAQDQRDYACLEDNAGNKFRVGCPGQLYYLLETAGVETVVSITYKGMEYVEAFKKELHQFEVSKIEKVQ